MALDEQVEKRVYDKLRAFDGLELSGNSPVDSSIASVLSQGEVLADNGEQYESIQEAVDDSDNWVFAGPGTYYENVVIDKDDFTLQGAGYDTLIDGGTTGNAINVKSSNTSISSISSKTTSGSSASETCVVVTGQAVDLSNIRIISSGSLGIDTSGDETRIKNTIVESADGKGILSYSTRAIISNTTVKDTGDTGINNRGHDSIVSNCIVRNTGFHGIEADTDGICIGNRVSGASENGLRVNSANDVILANNRVSDSVNSDIQNNGTGTLIEGNLTGSAN